MSSSFNISAAPNSARTTLPAFFRDIPEVRANENRSGERASSYATLEDQPNSVRNQAAATYAIQNPRVPEGLSPWASHWVTQKDESAIWEGKVVALYMGTIFSAIERPNYELIARVFPLRELINNGTIRVRRVLFDFQLPDRMPYLGVTRANAQTYTSWETTAARYGLGLTWEDNFTKHPEGLANLRDKVIQTGISIDMGFVMEAIYTCIHTAINNNQTLRKLVGILAPSAGIVDVMRQECRNFARLYKGERSWTRLVSDIRQVGRVLAVDFDTILVPQPVLDWYTDVHVNELSYFQSGPMGVALANSPDSSLIQATTPGNIRLIPTRVFPAPSGERPIDPLRTTRIQGEFMLFDHKRCFNRSGDWKDEPFLRLRCHNYDNGDYGYLDTRQCLHMSGLFDRQSKELTNIGHAYFAGKPNLYCLLKADGLLDDFVRIASEHQAELALLMADTKESKSNDAFRKIGAAKLAVTQKCSRAFVWHTFRRSPLHLAKIQALEALYPVVAGLGNDIVPMFYLWAALAQSPRDPVAADVNTDQLAKLFKFMHVALGAAREICNDVLQRPRDEEVPPVDVCLDQKAATASHLPEAHVVAVACAVGGLLNMTPINPDDLTTDDEKKSAKAVNAEAFNHAFQLAKSQLSHVARAAGLTQVEEEKATAEDDFKKVPEPFQQLVFSVYFLTTGLPVLGATLPTLLANYFQQNDVFEEWLSAILAQAETCMDEPERALAVFAASLAHAPKIDWAKVKNAAIDPVEKIFADAKWPASVKALLKVPCNTLTLTLLEGLMDIGVPCFINFLVARPSVGIDTYNAVAIDSRNAGNLFVQKPDISIGRDAHRKQSMAAITYNMACVPINPDKFFWLPNIMPIEYNRSVGGGGMEIFDPDFDCNQAPSSMTTRKSIYVMAVHPNEVIGDYIDITGYFPSKELGNTDTEHIRGPHYSTCNVYTAHWKWNTAGSYTAGVSYSERLTGRLPNTKLARVSHSFFNPKQQDYTVHVAGCSHFGSGVIRPRMSNIYFGDAGIPIPQAETENFGRGTTVPF